MSHTDVIIVGAGISGLACATELNRAGASVVLLEASDAVGGRMRTDLYQGFRLDRGFQVLLSAYPECRRTLDYSSLNLRPFQAGSIVYHGGKLHRISDPWQSPGRIVETLLAPIGSLGDKLRIGKLRRRLLRTDLSEVFSRQEQSTLSYLQAEGFSHNMIERFFRPFLGGVFLDLKLATSSRMFEFVFKMFSEGDVVVPDHGMQAIPESLAKQLPPDSIRLNSPVAKTAAGHCILRDGERLKGAHLVLATDGTSAHALATDVQQPAWNAALCMYFDAPEAPIPDPVLVLNGNGDDKGPVNSISVMSQVAPSYAPAGRSLIGVSVVGVEEPDDSVEGAALEQLKGWFGSQVSSWRPLQHYSVPRSLPAGGPFASMDQPELPDGLHVCGDHVENASIHGAMRSGRKVAQKILAK